MTSYLQARTSEDHLGFVPASQLEFLTGLVEACWHQSSLKRLDTLSLVCDGIHYTSCLERELQLLTMRSVIARAHWARSWSWSSWSTSWSTSSSRSQSRHWLLHPRHWPLPLDSHLQVVWQGLPPSQHFISHNLGSELMELILVEGSRASRATRDGRATRF